MITRARAAAIVTGIVAGFSPPVSIERVNADWLAALAAHIATPAPATDVALVLVDSRAITHPAFADAPRIAWSEPLSRVVSRLLDAGAATVALDLVFTRAESADPEWLAVLRRAARDGRIVLGGTTGAWPDRRQIAAAGGTTALAVVNLSPAPDGVMRTVPATIEHMPTLAAAASLRAGIDPSPDARIARPRLPAFVAWSAAAVLDCGDDRALQEAFAGRSVFIGAWLPHEDRHASALRRLPRSARRISVEDCAGHDGALVADEPSPGVLLHALAADSWIHDRDLIGIGPVASSLAVVTAALIGVAAAANAMLGSLALVVLAATVIAVTAFGAGLLVPWLACTVAAAFGAGTLMTLDHAHAAWRFAAGLPRRFRADPRRAAVQRLTACFIDIESFTRTSERLADPARLGCELGRCLTTLGSITEAHGGFVDKYIGDALLVLFGPEHGDDGRADAVAAVRACVSACAGSTPLRLCGRPVRLRIGLACGDARVGALGESTRLHFTAIGDAVNVAARLEQLNRSLGTRVLADASVVEATPGGHWRDRGLHELRGRASPVHVFELVGPPTVGNTHNPYNQHHARTSRSGTRHPDVPDRTRGSG